MENLPTPKSSLSPLALIGLIIAAAFLVTRLPLLGLVRLLFTIGRFLLRPAVLAMLLKGWRLWRASRERDFR